MRRCAFSSPHFGETNPLPDPITAPSVITPISEQLEGVTGDRAAATVKADDRILEKLSKLKDAEPFRANREAAASLSPDFPPPHRLVSAKMIFKVARLRVENCGREGGLRWLIAGE
jgi:hypothetical protein